MIQQTFLCHDWLREVSILKQDQPEQQHDAGVEDPIKGNLKNIGEKLTGRQWIIGKDGWPDPEKR